MRPVGTYTRRALEFALRHRWSLPLSLSSSACLLYLGDEMRGGHLDGIDATLMRAVQGWRGSMDGLMVFLTTIGGGVGMTIVSIVAVLWLARSGWRRAALFMSIAALGTWVLSTSLKLIFHRARPVDIRYLVETPASFSFPSGHAMGSMGVLASGVVVLYAVRAPRALRVLASVLAGLLAAGIALSRVYLGVHFPSDVLGGQLAAAAWVSALTGWFYPRLFPGEQTLAPADL